MVFTRKKAMLTSFAPLCIVMARGGSKRVPRKNVRHFCGKPMIAWPVQAAVSSQLFSSVVVSTEDAEIAAVGQQYGAQVPFMRPHEIADDFATTTGVLKHALLAIQTLEGSLPQYCCCLYGTSAMVTSEWLKEGYEKMQKTKAQCIYAVTEYAHPLERSLQFAKDGLIQYRYPEYVSTRTQDIEPSYHDIGLFYWFDVQAFLSKGGESFLPLRKSAVIVPRIAAVDIDTETDWEYAEKIMQSQMM